MGLLDNLSDGLNKGIGETSKLLELGKLKSSVSALSKERSGLFLSLGMHAYELQRRGAVQLEGAAGLYDRIRTIELEVGRLETQIESLSGAVREGNACPGCGTVNGVAAAFCAGCGAPIASTPEIKCAHCATALPPGASFCSRCGTVVKDEAGDAATAE